MRNFLQEYSPITSNNSDGHVLLLLHLLDIYSPRDFILTYNQIKYRALHSGNRYYELSGRLVLLSTLHTQLQPKCKVPNRDLKCSNKADKM